MLNTMFVKVALINRYPAIQTTGQYKQPCKANYHMIHRSLYKTVLCIKRYLRFEGTRSEDFVSGWRNWGLFFVDNPHTLHVNILACFRPTRSIYSEMKWSRPVYKVPVYLVGAFALEGLAITFMLL